MKRIVVSGLLLLCFVSVAFALTQSSIPAIRLAESIEIAENGFKEAGVDRSQYFIFKIEYTNSGKGYFWYYTYRPNKPNQYNEVFVRVYMTGEVEVQAPQSRRIPTVSTTSQDRRKSQDSVQPPPTERVPTVNSY